MSGARMVALNGFGRIGSSIYTQSGQTRGFRIAAINDLGPRMELSTGVEHLQIKKPELLPWKRLGIDYVVEATGAKRKRKAALSHLEAGASRVIVTSAMAKRRESADFNVIFGINHKDFVPEKHRIISALSCTSTCLAPVLQTLRQFSIQSGNVTVFHGYNPEVKDTEFSRTAKGEPEVQPDGTLLYPYRSGVVDNLRTIMPWLTDDFSSRGFFDPRLRNIRLDLRIALEKETDQGKISSAFYSALQNKRRIMIMHPTADRIGDLNLNEKPFSSVPDITTLKLRGRDLSMSVWGNNVWGYSRGIMDILGYIARVDA